MDEKTKAKPIDTSLAAKEVVDYRTAELCLKLTNFNLFDTITVNIG